MGRSDAIGPQEQFDVVIEDEQSALQGHNGYFLTVTDTDELKALSAKVREKEIFRLRTNASKRYVYHVMIGSRPETVPVFD